jgi:hypothetical protein
VPGLSYRKQRVTLLLVFCVVTAALYADPLYTITVRGLNRQFPLIAWQMTYRINAGSQQEAELQALANARRDGCEENSAYIVETTVTVTPGDTRPVAPVIIITPAPLPPPPKPEPEVEYQEAYKAGYDHGITGFLTGRGNFILNSEIPEKYREAQQEQGYKNGYARGYADEEEKAKRKARTPHRPAPSRDGNSSSGIPNRPNPHR